MAKQRKKPLSHGPKGGKKHTPGRDHNRKSQQAAKKRFQKRSARRRAEELAEARRQWQEWDSLPEDVQKLRPELYPKHPRPDDES